MDDIERDEVDVYLKKAAVLNVKEKGETIHYLMSRCLVKFSTGAKKKCCAILVKHPRKVNGEQVITLQLAQKPITKILSML